MVCIAIPYAIDFLHTYYPLLLRKDVLLFLFHPSSIQHHNTTVAKNDFARKNTLLKNA